MTEDHLKDIELIDRYLAGRLADSEQLMLETRIVEDPAFRGEIDLTVALRDGFRELERRQQLSQLLSSRTAALYRRRPLALAAAGVVLAAALSMIILANRHDEVERVHVSQVLYFEQKRGGEELSAVVWERGDVWESVALRFDVGVAPARAYRITIGSIDAPEREPAFEGEAVTQSDGEVVVNVGFAMLVPGSYHILLEPLKGPDGSPSITYRLIVQ